MKERYLANVSDFAKAYDYYTSLSPQISHQADYDLLTEGVHEVVVNGVTYIQANYMCDDKRLKHLCNRKYNL